MGAYSDDRGNSESQGYRVGCGERRGPVRYRHSPRPVHDPIISWKRDPGLTAKGVAIAPLYAQERVHPSVFAESVLRQSGEDSLGSSRPSESSQLNYYRHRDDWSNRLILGESCRVMASLLALENFGGKVQMIYYDPPYGISFKSRLLARGGQGTCGTTLVPTYRDAYKDGINSYLDNIYQTVAMARDLLTESGSIFVQIGSKNVNRLAMVLDEVFGHENRVEMIAYATSGGTSSNLLPNACNYLLWYSKDRAQCKYHQLYEPLSRAGAIHHMGYAAMVELEDGTSRTPTKEERYDPDKHLPKGARFFSRMNLESSGVSATGRSEPFTWRDKVFPRRRGTHWRVSQEGLTRLAESGRLDASSRGVLSWKRYEDEVPGRRVNNLWGTKMAPSDMHYIVETAESAIERCILMTTDPGDLVFDPTCGSGTTALVAENWGRRWITSDASRAGVGVARQRLITGVHPYHLLQDSREGEEKEYQLQAAIKPSTPKPKSRSTNQYTNDPAKGFVYKRVPTVSAATLAYDRDAPVTLLVNQPEKGKGATRLSAPFTVESHSPHRTARLEDAFETGVDQDVRTSLIDALSASGIDLRTGGEKLKFSDITPCLDSPLTHTGTTDQGKAAIMIAPDDCTLSPEAINRAIERAENMPSVKLVVAIAFAFEADSSPDQSLSVGVVKVLKAQANQDIKISNAKDGGKHDAFVLIGEPAVKIEDANNDEITIEVEGYSIYNPLTDQIEVTPGEEVQCWMIDTNYAGNSFFAGRIHFPLGKSDKQPERFAKGLGKHIDKSLWSRALSLKSSPFPKPKTGRIAIRIVTNTYTEMTTIREIPA